MPIIDYFLMILYYTLNPTPLDIVQHCTLLEYIGI